MLAFRRSQVVIPAREKPFQTKNWLPGFSATAWQLTALSTWSPSKSQRGPSTRLGPDAVKRNPAVVGGHRQLLKILFRPFQHVRRGD